MAEWSVIPFLSSLPSWIVFGTWAGRLSKGEPNHFHFSSIVFISYAIVFGQQGMNRDESKFDTGGITLPAWCITCKFLMDRCQVNLCSSFSRDTPWCTALVLACCCSALLCFALLCVRACVRACVCVLVCFYQVSRATVHFHLIPHVGEQKRTNKLIKIRIYSSV